MIARKPRNIWRFGIYLAELPDSEIRSVGNAESSFNDNTNVKADLTTAYRFLASRVGMQKPPYSLRFACGCGKQSGKRGCDAIADCCGSRPSMHLTVRKA